MVHHGGSESLYVRTRILGTLGAEAQSLHQTGDRYHLIEDRRVTSFRDRLKTPSTSPIASFALGHPFDGGDQQAHAVVIRPFCRLIGGETPAPAALSAPSAPEVIDRSFEAAVQYRKAA